ncbi:hypothetical protein FRC06_006228 [Ceratobasidium sp. 370]|nr:hypothetical protein FRC06_006228 [Ceratobasidium sp. 370]
MPLGALARCFLPLLATVPPGATNPFAHAPFTFPVFRANMNLCPMATDEQLQLYQDESVDIDLENAGTLPVAAADGFCFSEAVNQWLAGGRASLVSDEALLQANHFYRDWFWGEIVRLRGLNFTVPQAIQRVDLVGPGTILPEGRTDEGWWAYRQLILAVVDRPGGILDLAKHAMEQHRATPAERWRDARDENRRKVDGHPLDEYDVPIPTPGPFTSSLVLLDEVAELVFGSEVVTDRGTVDTVYRECCKVIVNRVWEKMVRRLKTSVNKSKENCAKMDTLLADARESGAVGDLMAALRHLKTWRPTAEKTLEAGDQPFLSREKELGELFQSLGHEQELQEAGKEKGKKRGTKASVRQPKSGSVLPSEAEIAKAQEHWNSYCQSVKDDRNCPVPLGVVCPRFNLLDGDQDIGMEEFRGVPPAQLWASLGLPGATQFPFAEQGSPTKAAARPKWHQVAGVLAILKGAFTAKLGRPARPTMLCDDVGLGKTLQIIGAISMIAHMHEQQKQQPANSVVPPPFAIEAGTPYFAGLERIPNRPFLVVVPSTLSSQWMEQLQVFTERGSFHILRFSNGQGSLSRYFSDPKGEYKKAAGPNDENASKVIILAESSAIATEVGRCFKVPEKRGGRAAQRVVARGDPDILQAKSGVSLRGSIWDVKFNGVAYDESHGLRNVSLLTMAAIRLSSKALVRIGATATPIFTGPKDIASQGRALRYEGVIGDAGEKLHEWLLEEQQQRGKEWEGNEPAMIAKVVNREALQMASAAGVAGDEGRVRTFLDQLSRKYESQDQIKMLKTSYVMQTSIDRLREVMLPIVLRRSGTSKDPSGTSILDLRPYKVLTGWAPVKECEQAELDRINEVQQEQQNLRRQHQEYDAEVLKWSNFLLTQKDAHMHHEIPRLKEEEKRADLREGALTERIGDDWDANNLAERASSRMLKTDEVVGHFWEGNPKPPVYREDGTRDLEAEARQEDPPPLEHPRKFLIYVQYRLHRILLKKVFLIRGRGFVEYDGTMSKSKRQAAIDKFQTDPQCRIMLISNVGAAGLNLTAASIVIFVVRDQPTSPSLQRVLTEAMQSGVWSGQEKKQIIGRPWRYGQTAEVIVIDILAPRGLDLALAGYAGSKTVMSDSFLRSERELNQAHKALTILERQYELGPDQEDEDEDKVDENTAPADVVQPNKSRVSKRKHKGAAATLTGEVISGNDAPESPPAKKRKSRAKDVEGTNAKVGRSRKAVPKAKSTTIKSGGQSTSSRASKPSVPTDSPHVPPVVEAPQPEAGPSKKRPKKGKVSLSASAEQPISGPSAKDHHSVLQRHESGSSSAIAIPRVSPPVQPSSPSSDPISSGPPPPMSSSVSQPSGPSTSHLPQADSARTFRKRPRPKLRKACTPEPSELQHSAAPDLFDLSRARAEPGASQAAAQPPSSSTAQPKAPSAMASVGAGGAQGQGSRALPGARIAGGTDGYTQDEIELAVRLGFADQGSQASLTSCPDALRSTPSSPHSTTAGPSSGGASSARGATVGLPVPRPPAVTLEPCSPIKSSDSIEAQRKKLQNMSDRQRGATAPIRVSLKRTHDAGATESNGTAASLTSSKAALGHPPGQDTVRQKHSGFQKRSNVAAPKAGNSQRAAQVGILDRRDAQIDKSTSGPRSPSRARKMSMFSGDK